jgi:putative hemolysin
VERLADRDHRSRRPAHRQAAAAAGRSGQLPLEDEYDYHTAAGMVIAQFGRIPNVGEHFEWSGWRIEIVDLDGPRVDKLLLQRLATSGGHDDAD